MAKAVLIMDMRDNCEDCDLFEANRMTAFMPYCYKANRKTKFKGRPKWCPLIPEPERMTDSMRWETIFNLGVDEESYQAGWNECIDALEGKNETD